MTRLVSIGLGRSAPRWRALLLRTSVLFVAVLASACSNYLGDGPDPARAGRAGGGSVGGSGGGSGSGSGGGTFQGEGGASAGSPPLVEGVSVNALALDDKTVYFSTNQGLAKVAKSGGNPVPLGGFSQLNGLALGPQAIYAVNGDGSLISVRKDGTSTMTLVPATCGGGSGAIALDAGNIFFTTGSSLRTAAIGAGAPSDLATDVWQAGGPATGARLALDADNIYYVGNSNTGGQGALFGVSRLSVGNPICMGMSRQGTRLATAKGSLAALIGDGTRLYFTDLTSNGLAPVLAVSAVIAPLLGPAQVTELASLTASNNSSQSAGNALTSDGTYLYFGAFAGIYRVLVDGPSCTAAALPCAKPELVVPGAMATALAVDEDFLYYGDQNGPSALKKLAK